MSNRDFGLSLFVGAFRANSKQREELMSELASKHTRSIRVATPPPVPWVSGSELRDALASDDKNLIPHIMEHDPQKAVRDEASDIRAENDEILKSNAKFQQERESKIDRIKEFGAFLRSSGVAAAPPKPERKAEEEADGGDDDDDTEKSEALAKRKATLEIINGKRRKKNKNKISKRRSLMPSRGPKSTRDASTASVKGIIKATTG